MWAQQCGKRGLDTTPVGSGSRRGTVGRGPGRTTSRRAERSSRRGRLTGGSPPTGTHSDQAPQVWRAPEGPEGTGGLRDNAPRHTPACQSPPMWRGVGGTGGPGCGARGRRRGLDGTTQHRRRHRRGGRRRDRRAWLRCPWAAAGPGRHHTAPKAPPAWRAPEGPEGTGGLRDRPLRAAGSRVAISRAAGPDGARNTRGATSNTSRKAAAHGNNQQPGPAGRAKRPARQHTTRRHKKHSTGARAHRPAPLDATTQTRQLRSTCVPYRSARAARRWRRSSRSPRLRRRAGPRR